MKGFGPLSITGRGKKKRKKKVGGGWKGATTDAVPGPSTTLSPGTVIVDRCPHGLSPPTIRRPSPLLRKCFPVTTMSPRHLDSDSVPPTTRLFTPNGARFETRYSTNPLSVFQGLHLNFGNAGGPTRSALIGRRGLNGMPAHLELDIAVHDGNSEVCTHLLIVGENPGRGL